MNLTPGKVYVHFGLFLSDYHLALHFAEYEDHQLRKAGAGHGEKAI